MPPDTFIVLTHADITACSIYWRLAGHSLTRNPLVSKCRVHALKALYRRVLHIDLKRPVLHRSPRFPPLVRLSTGNHGQMYGFPSAHSSTVLSMATFFALQIIWYSPYSLSTNDLAYGLLFLFIATITFGRLYTGIAS